MEQQGSLKSFIFVGVLGFCLGILITIWAFCFIENASSEEKEVATVTWKARHFMLNDSNLYDELMAQDVAFPEIVCAQAILETGGFKSHACKDMNNLFGLKKLDGTYMSFDHWTESVAAYKKYIQRWKIPPNDYYHYLDSMKYAEDVQYINKIKQLVNTE